MPVKTFGCQPTRKLSPPIGGDDNCAPIITQIKTIMNGLINRMIIVIIHIRWWSHKSRQSWMIIVIIYIRWWSHNQDNREWFDDQQSDHRDNLLGDGANRRGSCQCGDDGYHDQHSTRGDFKTWTVFPSSIFIKSLSAFRFQNMSCSTDSLRKSKSQSETAWDSCDLVNMWS